MDSPKDLKWTVLKSKMNGQKSQNGRLKRLKADGRKEWKYTVPK